MFFAEVEMVDREEEAVEKMVEGLVEQGGGEGEGFGGEDDEEEEWDRLFREVVDGQEGSGEKRGEGGEGDEGGGMDMS